MTARPGGAMPGVRVWTRPAAVAGMFYPASATALRSTVQGLLARAAQTAAEGARALLVPHAGYAYSGPTAAAAYACLRDAGRHCTVYLVGPPHRCLLDQVALSSASAFTTPLGPVTVAEDRVRALLELSPSYTIEDQAHADEHDLEVQLPFLQCLLPQVRVVPMLVGESCAGGAAADLTRLLADDPEALLVATSDLSHYHDYERAQRLDRKLLAAVVRGDRPAVAAGEACGRAAVTVLMDVADGLGWQPRLLDYANSGDNGGGRDSVVGYGAAAYYPAS